MDVSPQGIAVVKSFEGRALRAYKDCVGVWTIGYGNTNNDKFAVATIGRKIGPGVTITESQADMLLVESLRRGYGPAVAKALPGCSQQAYDGGNSFHYNTGAIARASWAKRWREHASASAIKAGLMQWSKGGGKVLQGLVRRRAREAAIINAGDYGPEGKMKPPVLNSAGKPVSVEHPEHPLNGTPGMITVGQVGPEVADLIDDLIALGYKLPKGNVYTPAAKEAVLKFQVAHPQLNDDGVAGPATRKAIQREIDAKDQVKTATTTTALPGGGLITADQAFGLGLPVWAYVAIGVVVLGTVAYFVWKYRDELAAISNRKG
jgi:lysozyme